MKSLNAKQQELLDAMREKGVKCHYMPYAGSFNPTAYYFRTDTMRRCTATAQSLLDRGLVKKADVKPYGDHNLIFKEAA